MTMNDVLLPGQPAPDMPPSPEAVIPPPADKPGNGGGDHGRWKRSTHLWARRLHVYTSMITLVVVLFFGVTGLTLNHPDWTFGSEPTVTTESGTFPFAMTDDTGAVQFLSIAEYVRTEYGVSGHVDSFYAENGEGSIAFKNAGYSADLFFDTTDATFDLTVTREGWVAVMNDLHKGRDTGSTWSWVIDLSAGFLVVISLTGLAMQLFLRKRRTAALVTAGVGAVATVVVVVLTLL